MGRFPMAEGSLTELIEQVRATSRSMQSVDLEKAGKGDPEFLARLGDAIDELTDVVENGAISSDPLVALLQRHGFGARIDKVYTGNRVEPFTSLADVPHRNGLPPFEICLAPDYSPIDGLQGIFLTGRGIFNATVPYPVEQHTWRVQRNIPYESPDDLIAKVRRFVSADPADRFR